MVRAIAKEAEAERLRSAKVISARGEAQTAGYITRSQAYARASQPAGLPVRDMARHVVTARLTKLAKNQALTWSLFVYYSPSDRDAYLRPNVSYKFTDAWAVEAGANLFFGAQPHTFFGQFEANSNIFASIRHSF